jgi:hypothetical protein
VSDKIRRETVDMVVRMWKERCGLLERELEDSTAKVKDLLAFAGSVVTLFGTAYPKAGLQLDMDKASILNAAREVIQKYAP